MELASLTSIRLEFLRRAGERREDERRVVERDLKKRKDKNDRDDKQEQDGEPADLALAVLATANEVATFTVTLDRNDAATVEALQLKDDQLAEARDKLNLVLDQAYVLPDGRRVFRTADGSRLVDEHDQEVTDIDVFDIEAWHPTYEEYSAIALHTEELLAERRELLEYQQLLDDTRELVDADEPLTQGELEVMRQRIEDNKPDDVKRILGEPDGIDVAAQAAADFNPASLTIRRAPGLSPDS